MSVSPAQKRSKPPPVPETPTVICTPEFSCWKRSAARVVNGPTVLEPSAWMRPERLSDPPPVAPAPDSSSSPPHAAPAIASTTARSDHRCDAYGCACRGHRAECPRDPRRDGVRHGERVVPNWLTLGPENAADLEPAAARALRLDGASRRADDVLHDREPEAGATRGAGPVRAVEALEQPRKVVLEHADPVVPPADDDRVALATDPEREASSRGRRTGSRSRRGSRPRP